MRRMSILALTVLMAGCADDPKLPTKANILKAARAGFMEAEKAGNGCQGPKNLPYQEPQS